MFISENNLAALTSTSLATIRNWAEKGLFPSVINASGIRGFDMNNLIEIPEIAAMVNNNWDDELTVIPMRDYISVELFAGAGGLALGMEKAGFKHILLNEFDSTACNTLRVNRPDWTVIEGDVRHIDFSPLRDKVDFLSGGFPCQAFSFAGKQGGFNDVRGTLFFELARAVKEIRPKVFLCENVKGLVSHDNGKTFRTIHNIISELDYTLITPRILKGIMYQVPQKRERIFLIAIRNDYIRFVNFQWPSPYKKIFTLKDALFKGDLYDSDVPESAGVSYPEKKRKVLDLVPQGGDWRNLPEKIAKEYMGGSWLLGGGKTGMARRLSLDEPSLTLTCSPAQKQTERCHPLYTRPLTIREYARIQTFPDDWIFQGTINNQYKQIGNAVPVNLAWAVGRALIRLLNDIETNCRPERMQNYTNAINKIKHHQNSIISIKDNKTQTSALIKGHRQLNLFEIYNNHSDAPIFENSFVFEKAEDYIRLSQKSSKKIILSDKLLIAYVKKEMTEDFFNQNARIYFTGQRFPATVTLNNLTFFMPYIKGKGIRDLYLIRKIHVAKYKKTNTDNIEYRMVFDIEFICQLLDDFKMCNLDIWRTYTDTTLNNITHLYNKK